MSKVGRQPIQIPAGITVTTKDGEIKIVGKKGEMTLSLLIGVDVAIKDGQVVCEIKKNSKQARSNWGTIRALVQNAIEGLEKDFEKTLILEGVGYKMSKEGNILVMALGFSHPVRYEMPSGISCEIEKNSVLKIKGMNKQLVGQVAANIRSMKKPEPYKGKGFRYAGEVIRRKAGKKAGTGSA